MECAQNKQMVETVPALGKNAWLLANDLKDDHHNASVNKKDMHELSCIFVEKIFIFQRLTVRLSSSSIIFTEFMCFSVWAMKQDATNLFYKQVDESLINADNFIQDADVVKRGSTSILANLFQCLDGILGGYPVKGEAWEQFSQAE